MRKSYDLWNNASVSEYTCSLERLKGGGRRDELMWAERKRRSHKRSRHIIIVTLSERGCRKVGSPFSKVQRPSGQVKHKSGATGRRAGATVSGLPSTTTIWLTT